MLRLMCMCGWNSVPVWISYRSFWQKWNFILGDKILCKHYPKWNADTCLSKYRLVLKCSQNETSCEQNLFSRWFEISNRYEFILPLMWTYSQKTKSEEMVASSVDNKSGFVSIKFNLIFFIISTLIIKRLT